ncbi:Transcription termination protein NusB [Lutibaculum baratangense AMV1]|uniref:Transcription antitermination protein NusB n=1 Tax=Lutibaculum baratangense AMV1 TaxID=631454 RepID=V4RJ21_9HYPH|nr:Transcription termination protein NusB [Lutibaculum baratangense AMV1]
MQALYQMDVGGRDLLETLAEFESRRLADEVAEDEMVPPDVNFLRDLLRGVVAEQRKVDAEVNRVLAEGWPLKRLDVTLRAILRAAGYELLMRRDVPVRAIISEYVDIARAFFEEGEEPSFANAVLDTLGRRIRADEFPAGRA